MTDSALEPNGRETGPVFISYTHRDGKEIVDFLETYLRAGGIIPWRDQRDLGDGRIDSTITEAMSKGLSGGILVVTPQLAESDFVSEVEVPALLKLNDDPPDKYSFQILNTIRDKETGALKAAAPDELLGAKLADSRTLRGIKQYALLAETTAGQGAASDMELLLTDLLKRRLQARQTELADREITIGVQTRPEVNAADADQRSGKENDLTIRLVTRRGDTIPTELSYRCLQQTLPHIIDTIYDEHIPKVSFEGGCHPSLAWALGAALPEARPRLEEFTWIDTRKQQEWSSKANPEQVTSWIECHRIDLSSNGKVIHPVVSGRDDESPQSQPSDTTRATRHDPEKPQPPSWLDKLAWLIPDDAEDIVVLLAARDDYQTKPLVELAQRFRNAAVVVLKIYRPQGEMPLEEGGLAAGSPPPPQAVGSPKDWMPPEEGAKMAEHLGKALRRLASIGKLHLTMAAPVGLLALTARQCNTLSIDIYERDTDVVDDLDRYVRVFRAVSGHSRPVARVFPQGVRSCEIRTLKNLTPHDVTLYAGDDLVRERGDRQVQRWPRPVGQDAWVRREETSEGQAPLHADGVSVPVVGIRQGELSYEPPAQPGVGYIVPRISAAHARRPDFFFPHREVRDEDGTIIGCLGLGSFPAVSDSARPYLPYLNVIGEE